jgi:hypothetical protein
MMPGMGSTAEDQRHPLWCTYGHSYADDDRINPFWTKGKSLVESRREDLDTALKPLEDVLGFTPMMVATVMWNKGSCGTLRELGTLMLGEHSTFNHRWQLY